MPAEGEADNFIIGSGVRGKQTTQGATKGAAGSSTAGRLPFGMETLVTAASKRKSSSGLPAQGHGSSADGNAAGEANVGEEDEEALAAAAGNEDTVPADPAAPVLSVEATREWDAALGLERAEQVAQEQALPAAEVEAEARSERASSSRAPNPVGNARGNFNSSLGIVGVMKVQRAGVVCAHCGDAIPKSSVRLQLAQKASKPCRSIHPACVLQLPEEFVEDSIRFLHDAGFRAQSAQEREARAEAEGLLRSLG